MTHVTYTVGQGFDSNNQPITNLADKRAEVLHDVAARFGGYTAHDAYGGWIDNAGKLISEPSIIIDVMTDASETVIHNEAQYIARTFDQSAVMLSESPVSVDFVSQAESIAA